ncbi:MAG: hypothetical protein P9L92_09275 [Candidatus Electryonea clarkiae]|nr:hypothetical protein [Candidatus Electryonea clarkiae]MDP8286629.1 hypothetical protein [Candidatus Electryonea clarkiae]
MSNDESSSSHTSAQASGLSIRDMVRLASLNLRGTSRKLDDGYIIEMRNYDNNLYTSIKLIRSSEVAGGTSLTVNTGLIKSNATTSGITLFDLMHLYVTWDSPGVITFCYSGEGRYTIINVSQKSGAFVLSKIDKRADEEETDLSEEALEARKQRRTFYHIGTLFKQTTSSSATEDATLDQSDDGEKAESDNF